MNLETRFLCALGTFAIPLAVAAICVARARRKDQEASARPPETRRAPPPEPANQAHHV